MAPRHTQKLHALSAAHAPEYTLSSSIQSTKVTRHTVLRLPVMFRVLPRKILSNIRWHELGGVCDHIVITSSKYTDIDRLGGHNIMLIWPRENTDGVI